MNRSEKSNRTADQVRMDAASTGKRGSSASQAGRIDFERLFENAPDAVLVFDDRGWCIAANRKACELTGYSNEEFPRRQINELVGAEGKSGSVAWFQILKKSGHSRNSETLRRRDGTTVPVEVHAAAVGNATYVTVLRDVAEQTRKQEAVQRSLDALTMLLELCHAALIMADAAGRIRSWNPGAEALFGYPAAEAIGMPLVNLVPPRLRDAHLRSFQRHVDSRPGSPFTRTIHTVGLRKDGSEVPIEISIAVGQQDGEPIFTGVLRDVSEQQQMLERLNDALQRLQFHVERMPLAYIVWGADFRVVEWNPAAERIFGFTRAEALGRHGYELIVPEDAIAAVEPVWADLLEGDTSSHSINPNVRRDGSRLTCEWFNTPLRDSAGRITGVASMVRDISEREIFETRLRDAQKLESLGILAGGVAHDFNSSLMVILGNAALLRGVRELPSRAREYIELIEQAGARADALIKHLLAYARTGRHNPQPTDLNAVIEQAAKLVQSSLGRQHRLKVKLAPQLPMTLADHSQIEQVLLNLCLNAKEAMAGEGVIEVETKATQLSAAQAGRCVPYDVKPGRYVELTVRDSGCGILPEHMSRIFDPFFTTKAEGHGLGMAAVLGILRQHRAGILVESKPGKGTTMRVFLPESSDAAAAKSPGGAKRGHANRSKTTRRTSTSTKRR